MIVILFCTTKQFKSVSLFSLQKNSQNGVAKGKKAIFKKLKRLILPMFWYLYYRKAD